MLSNIDEVLQKPVITLESLKYLFPSGMPKKATKIIGMTTVLRMAHKIGLPGDAGLRNIALAYADYFGVILKGSSGKFYRAYLKKVQIDGIEIQGINPYVPKSKTAEGKKNPFIFKLRLVKKANAEDVVSSDFLKSYKWRELRMKALQLYGRRCGCCGATPETGAVMHVDHIKPRRFHPELALDINNLQILCEECNHGKGNWDETDWRNK